MHTSAEALGRVEEIYGPYAEAVEATPLLGNCFLVPPASRPCTGPPEEYVTAGLRATLERRANEGTGADPLICAQNTPASITYGTPRVTDSSATIVVRAGFTASGDHPIVVTVELSSLQLTDVRC